MTLSINWPSGLQTSDQQTQVIQRALADIQREFNRYSTQAAVLVHLPSQTLTTTQATTGSAYSTIPGYSWTINSMGGLVDIAAIFGGVCQDSDAGTIGLLLDNRIVLEESTHALNGGSGNNAIFNLKLAWRAVLGKGQHSVAFQFKTVSGVTIAVNSTNRGPTSSSVSIVEFPANVSNVNVSAAK